MSSSPQKKMLREVEEILEFGNEKNACELILNNPNLPLYSDEDGRTALIAASFFSYPDVISLLIKSGSDVNAKSMLGETPLINVVRGAAEGISIDPIRAAKELLLHGADPNQLAYDGCNALHIAVIHAQRELIKLFLEFGADPRIRLNDPPSNENALELAKSSRSLVPNDVEIVRLLQDKLEN